MWTHFNKQIQGPEQIPVNDPEKNQQSNFQDDTGSRSPRSTYELPNIVENEVDLTGRSSFNYEIPSQLSPAGARSSFSSLPSFLGQFPPLYPEEEIWNTPSPTFVGSPSLRNEEEPYSISNMVDLSLSIKSQDVLVPSDNTPVCTTPSSLNRSLNPTNLLKDILQKKEAKKKKGRRAAKKIK